MAYHAPDPSTWIGRSCAEPLYVHQNVRMLPLDNAELEVNQGPAILGYACEEGVRRNQGRVGAAKGPEAFRKALGRLPWHQNEGTKLWDAGDVACEGQALEEAQEELATRVDQLLGAGRFPLVIGGGHDVGYGHYRGLRAHLGDRARIGIINFDAHFDLRSPNPAPNSGTPFLQVAQDCERLGLPFDYLCLGIRKDANDRSLFQKAQALGATWIEHEDPVLQSGEALTPHLDRFLAPLDALYVTVCLDVFSSAYSPGVSAAYPHGMNPEQVFSLLQPMLASPKLASCDIAELSPVHDRDSQSAKLAAVIALRFIAAATQ